MRTTIKKLLSSPVAIVTFFAGVAIVVLLQFQLIPDAGPVESDAVAQPVECARPRDFPGVSIDISTFPKSKGEYFPKEVLSSSYLGDYASVNDWYGKTLRLMHESSLFYVTEPNIEVYRFVWLRTFHHPISVRVERTLNGTTLYTAELSGMGGYEPAGRIIRSKTIRLGQTSWCELLSRIDKSHFWIQQPMDTDIGPDGATWVLEGVREGRYQFVQRWSPSSGDFRDACIYMLELSGIDTGQLGDDLY